VKGRDYFEDLGTDGRTILLDLFNKYGVRVLTGFMLL
jgi:hypothetical protein